jgi:hypothetical protein
LCHLWYNVKKYCRVRQATDDNMTQVRCLLDTQGYKQTLSEYVILLLFSCNIGYTNVLQCYICCVVNTLHWEVRMYGYVLIFMISTIIRAWKLSLLLAMNFGNLFYPGWFFSWFANIFCWEYSKRTIEIFQNSHSFADFQWLTLWSLRPSEAWALPTFCTAYTQLQLRFIYSCMSYNTRLELGFGSHGKMCQKCPGFWT